MNRNHSHWTMAAIVAIGIVPLFATAAAAHSVNRHFGDFYGGMLHPLTALEHLVPILGLGLLAGQQGTSAARWILLLFPAGLLLGAAVATQFEPSQFVEGLNRLSFVAIGGLVAIRLRVPLLGLAIAAPVLGFLHGYENTAGISSSVAIHLFISGIVVTGIAMIAIFAAISVSRESDWQKIAIRVVGSWITAIGILMIGLQ